MFETTLEAATFPADRRKALAVTAAVCAHGALLLAVIAASALTIRPFNPPDLPPCVVWVAMPAPDPPALVGAIPRPPAPVEGVRKPGPAVPTPERPAAAALPPASISDHVLPAPPDHPGRAGDGEGRAGDPDGDPFGVPGGVGTGPAPPGPSADDDPVLVGPGVTEPVLVTKIEPAYPTVARLARISGKVVLQAVIGLDGSVESAEILSSTSPLFDGEALTAVRRWKYRPATMNGRPVRAYFRVAVDFVLR